MKHALSSYANNITLFIRTTASQTRHFSSSPATLSATSASSDVSATTQPFSGNLKKALAGIRRIDLEGLRWRVFDAKGQVLGRLAAQISTVVQGKDKPTYSPQWDQGDMCIVINAKDVCVTGRKLTNKFYRWHTGYWAPEGEEFEGPTSKGPHGSHPESSSSYASKKQIT
ncbi:unnamed protein product [Cuscuta epithymum]|uniref:Uncharacterized protein n=1 Tax=Cuscuta epithymum TaxID=186058 RepID=A0AAV0FJS1_9ASTE|nr:unnamed protein product [Cuscuta epithymum]